MIELFLILASIIIVSIWLPEIIKALYPMEEEIQPVVDSEPDECIFVEEMHTPKASDWVFYYQDGSAETLTRWK